MSKKLGWIKLYRELLDKPIWLNSKPEHKVIIITILLMANHEQKQWEWNNVPFKVEKGQFVTSLNNIASRAGRGVSVQNVRTCLKRLETLRFLTNKATKSGRVITVLNWDSYQEDEQKLTNELTANQQTPNKRLTTNKNVKNDKNIYIILKDGTNYIPDDEFIEKMKNTYSSVDIESELKKMSGWSISNLYKRKTKRGIKKFINSWLSRAHDKINKEEKEEQSPSYWNEVTNEEIKRRIMSNGSED